MEPQVHHRGHGQGELGVQRNPADLRQSADPQPLERGHFRRKRRSDLMISRDSPAGLSLAIATVSDLRNPSRAEFQSAKAPGVRVELFAIQLPAWSSPIVTPPDSTS